MEEGLPAQEVRRSQAQETYRINQVQTASREQLLLLTYDIGIRASSTAERAIREGDGEKVNEELKRGQAVLRELMVTLRLDVAGEVGPSLMGLYDFMHNQLIEANVSKDEAKIASVRHMFEELRSTWQEALTALQAEAKDEEPQVQAQVGGLNFAG